MMLALRRLATIALLGALALFGALGGAAYGAEGESEGPPVAHWDVITRAAPTNLKPGGTGVVIGVIVNLGDAPVLAEGNPVKITDTLPARLEATGPIEGYATRGDNEQGGQPEIPLSNCKVTPLSCEYVGRLDPFIAIEFRIPVTVRPGAEKEQSTNTIAVEGANVAPKVATGTINVNPEPTSFGLERFELMPEEQDGAPALQAGSHPFQLTTTIELNQTLKTDPFKKTSEEYPSTPELTRNLTTTLPTGLVADARASVFPQCTAAAFATLRSGNSNECPADTAIGVAIVTFKEEQHFAEYTTAAPVFNLVPERGEPARFGFVFEKVPVILDTSVQTGNGYAVQVKVENTSQAAELLSSIVTIWGVPGDVRHENARGWECLGGGFYVEGLEPRPTCPKATTNPPPYLIMPTTSCGQALSGWAAVQSWTQPSFGRQVPLSDAPTQTGCSNLPFNPTIVAEPDQHEVSTPTGLNVEVKVPQNTTLSAGENAEADVKATTVTLPEEMMANAGSADGLGLCKTEEIGFESSLEGPLAGNSDGPEAVEREAGQQAFTPDAAACPDASKVGTVKIKTPLLENELTGYVYFGSQDVDPFASPLVLYIVAEDPESGVRVKLAGEVKLDSQTGRVTSVFKNTPPLPFERLELRLNDGPRATQTTPAFCRAYPTNARFVPSTAEDGTETGAKEASSSFSLTPNKDGQACPAQGPLPFAPGFNAEGNPQAAGFTPFSLSLARPDGQQALESISVTLPPGMAALLANVPLCPQAQAEIGQCSSESEVGYSTAHSGLGSDPVSLPGKVYLTEGYGGAPFGLVDVTEATVEPFHLGLVIVRSKITVDPYTAAVTVTSDPIPRFVKGVPSQIKELNVTINRPNFEFNPTNCSQFAINGTLAGYEGTNATVSTPYRVTNCGSLPFKPTLTSSASGHGSKANGVGFNVKITSPGLGQAGIQKVFLTIPKILPSRLTTIQKACPDSVFEANPEVCDEGSLIGEGTIYTPVFRNPLRGPAYLVSHAAASFPDVEFVLRSEGAEKGVKIILDGKTDIKKGVTYSRFESSPDAPFTKFETSLPAGPHSALTINNEEAKNYEICSKKVVLPTEITGQNGAVIKQNTSVALTGCGAVKAFKESRSQKLAKALSKCRKQFKHNKRKRQSCEKAARKKYGAKKAKKTKKSKKKK
jgi:ribosomal protein S9